jgi:hypothetical protein
MGGALGETCGVMKYWVVLWIITVVTCSIGIDVTTGTIKVLGAGEITAVGT